MSHRSSRPRLAGVLLFVLSGAWSSTAHAQDRLFVRVSDGVSPARVVEVGAIGRFGTLLGPAPAGAETRIPPPVQYFAASPTTIVDLRSGTTVFVAPPGETIQAWTATPDATRLFVTARGGSLEPSRIRAVDVASQAVVGDVAAEGDAMLLQWLPGDRVLVRSGAAFWTYEAFDRDLRRLARLPVGGLCPPQWHISAHTNRAYFLYTDGYGHTDYRTFLAVYDALSGRKLQQVNLNAELGVGAAAGCATSASLTLWTAPPAPRSLAATVVGRDVRLSWLSADGAEGYVVDVGLAPGRADLGMFVGRATDVIFANAPAGTYYVRVRGGNAMGGGRPSNEVRVVVP